MGIGTNLQRNIGDSLSQIARISYRVYRIDSLLYTVVPVLLQYRPKIGALVTRHCADPWYRLEYWYHHSEKDIS